MSNFCHRNLQGQKYNFNNTNQPFKRSKKNNQSRNKLSSITLTTRRMKTDWRRSDNRIWDSSTTFKQISLKFRTTIKPLTLISYSKSLTKTYKEEPLDSTNHLKLLSFKCRVGSQSLPSRKLLWRTVLSHCYPTMPIFCSLMTANLPNRPLITRGLLPSMTMNPVLTEKESKVPKTSLDPNQWSPLTLYRIRRCKRWLLFRLLSNSILWKMILRFKRWGKCFWAPSKKLIR